jgi:two component transcriptional regulator, winged helix family protein
LKIDKQQQTVTRAGKNIDLTNKEYALLEYLIQHPNQILSKETLIDHVWDFDADILPNNVEAYIKNLRQKIDKPFKKQLIKTVRGFGYRIES